MFLNVISLLQIIADMRMEVNGVSLNYIEIGEGDPLILLHGNGEDHQIFNVLISKLQQHFCVYAIDSRNHGDSSKTDDFSYSTMAADIFTFIKVKGIEKPSVIGFSDGGIIALLMSMSEKNIFDKMILLGVNLKPSDFKDYILESLVDEFEKTQDPLLKLMIEEPNIDICNLKDIDVPTLLVAGEDDIFKEETFTSIVQTMPNAQLLIMKGHDHGSYIVDSDVLFPYVKDFL